MSINPSSFRSLIGIDARSKAIHARYVGQEYIYYSIMRYLGPANMQRGIVVMEFARYFGCRFSGDDSQCAYGIPHALWQTGREFGRQYADCIATDSIRFMHDDQDSGDTKQPFATGSSFIKRRISTTLARKEMRRLRKSSDLLACRSANQATTRKQLRDSYRSTRAREFDQGHQLLNLEFPTAEEAEDGDGLVALIWARFYN